MAVICEPLLARTPIVGGGAGDVHTRVSLDRETPPPLVPPKQEPKEEGIDE
jgi:hypothetical protein